MEKSEVVNDKMDNLLSGTQAEFIGCHRDIVTNGTNAALYLVRMCKALKTMNDRKLYEVAGFTSFGEYTEKAVGLKVRQAYNYISLLDKFSPEFLENNFNLGVSKLLVLSRLGESEAKEVIEKNNAGEMSVEELKRLIAEKDEKIRQLEIEAIKDTEDEIKAREKKYEQEKSRLQTELDTAIKEREEARTKYDNALSDNARIKEENKKLKDGSKSVERVEVDKPETLAALEESKKAIEAKDKEIEALLKKMKVATDSGLAKFKLKFNDLQNVISDISEILSELDEENRAKCKRALKQVVSEVA